MLSAIRCSWYPSLALGKQRMGRDNEVRPSGGAFSEGAGSPPCDPGRDRPGDHRLDLDERAEGIALVVLTLHTERSGACDNDGALGVAQHVDLVVSAWGDH